MSDVFSADLKVGEACPSCQKPKKASIEVIELTFRSDHVEKGNKDKKILRKAKEGKMWFWSDKLQETFSSSWGDPEEPPDDYVKPEWTLARNGPRRSYPISHTKGNRVTLDVKFRIRVPKGKKVTVKKITGVLKAWGYFSRTQSTRIKLTFRANVNKTFTKTTILPVKTLKSKQSLPDVVGLIRDEEIKWYVNGRKKSFGSTGPHTIYVTFDDPSGQAVPDKKKGFDLTAGKRQAITDARLEFSVMAAIGTGRNDNERECVHAVFLHLCEDVKVHYSLGYRWNEKTNVTGIEPKPENLHHYLWLCNTGRAFGECHNIAAGFALACKILGIRKSFEIGYMFPRPMGHSRAGAYSTDPANGQFTRSHGTNHGSERLIFLDNNQFGNRFEGVANYNNEALYAIGELCYGFYQDPEEDASTFYERLKAYEDRTITQNTPSPRVPNQNDRDYGVFPFVFSSSNIGYCDNPYPSLSQLFPKRNPRNPQADPIMVMGYYWRRHIH